MLRALASSGSCSCSCSRSCSASCSSALASAVTSTSAALEGRLEMSWFGGVLGSGLTGSRGGGKGLTGFSVADFVEVFEGRDGRLGLVREKERVDWEGCWWSRLWEEVMDGVEEETRRRLEGAIAVTLD